MGKFQKKIIKVGKSCQDDTTSL